MLKRAMRESAEDEVESLEEQNRALREALKFYADQGNWKEDDWNVRSVIQPPEYGNPGAIARAALGESGEEGK